MHSWISNQFARRRPSHWIPERAHLLQMAARAAIVLFAYIPAAAQPAAGFVQHPLPNIFLGWAGAITAGPDGAMWYARGTVVGRLSLAGVFTEYTVPAANAGQNGITSGPDGALWFLDGNKVGRMTTSGTLTEFPTPSGGNLIAITSGFDGALWFLEQYNDKIGRITTSGVVTEFQLPHNTGASGITAGPDGAIWIAEAGRGKIGRFTSAGLTEFNLGDYWHVVAITSGPDGALWFTSSLTASYNVIGRITTSGAVTFYQVPTTAELGELLGITRGPDGALWFTEMAANQIGRITTDGQITEYPIPQFASTPCCDFPNGPSYISAGVDGSLWFTEYYSQRIGQTVFQTAGLSVNPASTVPGSDISIAGTGFLPKENVDLYLDSTALRPLATATADSAGSFTTTRSAPPANFGANSIAGVGQTSRSIGVAPLLTRPALRITPATASPGETITVTGAGFAAGDRVALYWNRQTKIGTITCDDTGSFYDASAATFSIPANIAAGTHYIEGDGFNGAVGFGSITIQ